VRVFRLPELRGLALRFQLAETPAGEICVARPVAPVDPARVIAAMQAAMPHARIEMIDYSRQPAPEGELDFSPAGLRGTTASAVWTGAVRYAGNRRFSIWAKVKVTVAAAR